jgi:trehalose 6-phosphate synthase
MTITTSDSIRQVIAREFRGRKIIAVSNCEPFSHFRNGGKLDCAQPASGMISAIDPIMRVAGGTWIAQGSGDADREAVDRRSRVAVPPGHPAYTLRRVWLTPELKNDYYYGLANETIWPVCHLTFHRPRFREKWWNSYRRVNQIFAEAVLEEAAGGPAVVLIQDYHFALLSRILKQRNPNLRIAQFWHIPWPSPETIGILPWKSELLDGMLGNDLLAFHLPEHCENFLAVAAHSAQGTVSTSSGSTALDGHVTAVRPLPISIDFARH